MDYLLNWKHSIFFSTLYFDFEVNIASSFPIEIWNDYIENMQLLSFFRIYYNLCRGSWCVNSFVRNQTTKQAIFTLKSEIHSHLMISKVLCTRLPWRFAFTLYDSYQLWVYGETITLTAPFIVWGRILISSFYHFCQYEHQMRFVEFVYSNPKLFNFCVYIHISGPFLPRVEILIRFKVPLEHLNNCHGSIPNFSERTL